MVANLRRIGDGMLGHFDSHAHRARWCAVRQMDGLARRVPQLDHQRPRHRDQVQRPEQDPATAMTRAVGV